MLTLEKARDWYADQDEVHGFNHIERVSALCTFIGTKEKADMRILQAAALLHDASGSHPGEGQRKEHHIQSADFADQVLNEEGWDRKSIGIPLRQGIQPSGNHITRTLRSVWQRLRDIRPGTVRLNLPRY